MMHLQLVAIRISEIYDVDGGQLKEKCNCCVLSSNQKMQPTVQMFAAIIILLFLICEIRII